MSDRPTARLVGPLSIDRYLDVSVDLPGGGALNMAYHWAQRDMSFELIGRVARDQSAVFERFLERHQIDHTPALITDGDACTVDVRFGDDRQPNMDNFVEGVLADFRLNDDEANRLRSGVPTHFVLVDVMDRELHRLVSEQPLSGGRLTGDFLSFRHFTAARFESTMAHLELGVIGWPGDPTDPIIAELVEITQSIGNVLVVTFGSKGVRVVDARSHVRNDRWFDVDAQPVTGTTVGCGDAFIAAFLAEWFTNGDIEASVDAGRELGAAATTWDRPLPDRAYA